MVRIRDMHQQLLVGVAAELGFGIEALVPGLLANLAPRARRGFVQRVDGTEVDLLVDVVLQGRSDVVGMIVCSV